MKSGGARCLEKRRIVFSKLVLAILLSLPVIVNGQALSGRALDPAAESRLKEILKGLEADNTLRSPLERGIRGEGAHHVWMEKMRQLGIKQASFKVGFEWNGKVESLRVKNVSMLRQYYRYDTRIRDRSFLRRVRDSGLDQELRDAILLRARAAVPQLMQNVARTANANPRRAHGTLYLNLLDDEALPILDEVPTVEW